MTIQVPGVGRDTWSSLGGVSRCDKLCDSLSVCSNDVIVFHYSRYYKHQTHNDTHTHHLLLLMRSLMPPLSLIFNIKRSLINRGNIQCVIEHAWWPMLMGGHIMMLPWYLRGHYYHIWYLNISEVRHHRQTILQAMNIHYHECTEPGPQSSHANEAKIMQITSQGYIARSQSEARIESRGPMRWRETPRHFGLVAERVTWCKIVTRCHARPDSVTRMWQCQHWYQAHDTDAGPHWTHWTLTSIVCSQWLDDSQVGSYGSLIGLMPASDWLPVSGYL